MHRPLAFVATHPAAVLTAVAALSVLAVLQILDIRGGGHRIEVDPTVDRLLPEDDAQIRFYHRIRRSFGNDEAFLVAVTADDIFTGDVLQAISRISDRVQGLAGVRRVVSLTTAPDVPLGGDGSSLAPAVTAAQTDPQAAARLRAAVLGDSIYRGSLVSADATAAAILIYLDPQLDHAPLKALDTAISRILAEERGPLTVWLTGTPHVTVALTTVLLHDLYRTVPMVALILALVLAFSFRRLHGVLIPLLTVGVALVWTLGTIVWLGYALNIVTVLAPPLLLVLGLSYSVHVVAEYQLVTRGAAPAGNPVTETLARITLPVLLTGLTTIAGFLSLVLNPIDAVREFGLFTVIGVSYATLASLTVAPALLGLLRPAGGTAPHPGTPAASLFDRLIDRVALFDYRAQTPIFIGAALIFVLGLAGMSQIRVGFEHINNFRPDSETRQAFERTNALFNGATAFYVIVQASYKDAWKEPSNLRTLKTLQAWLETQPEVGATTSIVDYLTLLARAFDEGAAGKRQIPETRNKVSQMLFFGSSEESEQFIDARSQLANIVVRTRATDSDVTLDLVRRIEQHLAQLPEHLQARVTGYPVLISGTVDRIIRGQALSVSSALLIVYALLATLFLSFRIGLITLIPNILPVVAYFGALGILGITLNPGTSVVAPMVLGIAIDDTIHYFVRFNRELKAGLNEKQATVSALQHVGRPVTYTTLGLCLGFLAFTSAELRMQAEVGLMACFALAFAWLVDFILTPALCARTRFVTLWDCVSLDLGSRPQDTIPLFKGLSTFQARIVARMTNIRHVPAGERLIRHGETGRELFAVITGSLQASIEGESGRIALDTHERGDLVGEAGLYFGQRTADVDVLEDSQLLCITQHSLERLRKRYPRIAAKVLRNLNEVLALRLAHATDRLA